MKDQKDLVLSRQDRFLEQLKQATIPVAIYLKNGVKLLGTIALYDDHVIMLRGSIPGYQSVFKHSILTIVPQL